MSKPIPKFTSFKARSSAPTQILPQAKEQSRRVDHHDENDVADTESRRDSDRRKHKDRADDVYTHKDKSHTRSHSHTHGHGHSTKALEPLTLLHDDGLQSFTVDTKGDPDNTRYGSLHRYSVPPYHRTGYGRILGSRPEYKIDLEASDQANVVLASERESKSERPERALSKKIRVRDTYVLRNKFDAREGTGFDAGDDFVALPGSRKRKRESESPKGIHRVDYRSIEGKSDLIRKPADEDLEYEIDDRPEGQQDPSSIARGRVSELERRVKMQPALVETWLELVKEQSGLVSPGVEIADLSSTDLRVLADMRVSIYKKGIRAVATADRLVLQLGMVEEISRIWEPHKTLKLCKEVLNDNPTNVAIWTRYLGILRESRSGSLEGMKQQLIECVQDIQTFSKSATAEDKERLSIVGLYVLLLLTTVLRDAGYEELAMGIWQAVLETQLYQPSTPDTPDHELSIKSFEDFWDSEVPRFGEEGSKGWINDQEPEKAESLSTNVNDDDMTSLPLSGKQPFASFANMESATSRSACFPGRTIDDVDTDDPFRVVLSSDLSEVLQLTSSHRMPSSALIDAFLCFFGLPSLAVSDSDSLHHSLHPWRTDAGIRGSERQSERGRSQDSAQSFLHRYQMSTDLLFTDAFPTTEAKSGPANLQMLNFVRRSLGQLVILFSADEDLIEYYLAFSVAYFPETAFKTAKSLLKARPSSLRLYNACALVQASLGEDEKAARIWQTAISMGSTFAEEDRKDVVLLWQSWVWRELQVGNVSRPKSLLFAFGGTQKDDWASTEESENISSSARLRVQRELKDGWDHAVSNADVRAAAIYSDLEALAAYLTDSKDPLVSAVEVCTRHIEQVQSKVQSSKDMQNPKANSDAKSNAMPILLERLHQNRCKLMRWHIHQRRPYKPPFVRTIIETSIRSFPNNTLFLSFHAKTEEHHRLDDRIRSVMREGVLYGPQSNIVGWTFALAQEIRRYQQQASGSTAHAVRSAFQKAVKSNRPGAHSPAVWNMWLDFERDAIAKLLPKDGMVDKRLRKDIEGSFLRVKQVFLDGLRAMPLSKPWILHGLRFFDRDDGFGWSFKELKGVWNVLQERGMRIRTRAFEESLDRNGTVG